MNTFYKIMALLALLTGLVACNDDDDQEEIKPVLDVNYANIAGTWQLSEWNGERMEDARYYYITFDRKAVDGKRGFLIYTNLNSATSQRISGAFTLERDDELYDLISGTYDYQLSTDDEWLHEYIITNLYEDSMVWTAKDDEAEIRVYKRCDEVPEDIVLGTRGL